MRKIFHWLMKQDTVNAEEIRSRQISLMNAMLCMI